MGEILRSECMIGISACMKRLIKNKEDEVNGYTVADVN